MIPAESSSFLHGNHSPLCCFQALVGTTLEIYTSALANAVSTTASKPRSDELLACKSELELVRDLIQPPQHLIC